MREPRRWKVESRCQWSGDELGLIEGGSWLGQVAVGAYVSRNFEKPEDQMTVEVTDDSVWRSSEYLQHIIPRLLPSPRRFRQVCTSLTFVCTAGFCLSDERRGTGGSGAAH
eukprot:413008-Rhodomonas_salina.3